MLGVVYALTKFHQYTYGRHITVITDHKPLESLRKKNINNCPARLQRMFLRIQAYDYTIVYRARSKILFLTACHGVSLLVPDAIFLE